MRTKRRALSADERAHAAEGIVEPALDLLAGHIDIAAYAAIDGELDPAPLLEALRRAGARVSLPRVVGDALEFVELTDSADTNPGSFGVPEPVGPARDLHEITAFLVPGVAFTADGARLGFGKGFYDRLMQDVRARVPKVDKSARRAVPLFVGIAYLWQIVRELPTEPHDQVLDLVLSWPSGPRTF
jgi:5-formyltetrahydrofolate cyclo-ligase